MHNGTGKSPLSTPGFRSMGEQAFDRCLRALAFHFIQGVALFVVSAINANADDDMPPAPRLIVWAMFFINLLLCLHWARACRNVVGAWHDPFAKVLRFSSLGLLLLYTPVIVGILRLPFQ